MFNEKLDTRLFSSDYLLPSGPLPDWQVRLLWCSIDSLTAASVWHVLLITIDRFIAFVHPITYVRLKENTRVGRYITALWIGSLSLCFVPVLFLFKIIPVTDAEIPYMSKYGFDCVLIYGGHVLPMVVILGMHINLLVRIRKKRKQEMKPAEEMSRIMEKSIR